ncbi:MAG: aldo/keto reductase [Clostridia bacterium]|nr:aldo/keto reductase [Clostridia bacterium]
MRKKLIFGSGLSSYKSIQGLTDVCTAALECGITSFDSAPSYKTETLISEAVKRAATRLGIARDDYYIQTKIDPIHMYNGHIAEYFKGKLKEMGIEYIDCLLIHWPVLNYLYDTWNALVKLKNEGIAKEIGICNLRIRHLKKLSSEGIFPDTIQIERHPLNAFREEAEWCVDNNITLQDYSPLCKMHPLIRDNESVKSIAGKYNKNVGQVILRWHIDTGAVPVFTSKNSERIRQYSDIWDFKLTEEEIETIYLINCNHKLYLESLICPGF